MQTSEDLPQTSSGCVLYEYVPPEIIQRFDDYLGFEDSSHFQISDDPSDCYLQCSYGRSPKRQFCEENLSEVLEKCENIDQVVIVIKEMGNLFGDFEQVRLRSMKETTPYHQGGYLASFFMRIPPQIIARLKSVSLHVDIMRESFGELWFPCPVQDLRYCISNLVDAHFETFVQISFCSASMHPSDYDVRNFLINGMENVLKEMTEKDAKTDFSIDVNEGYVDMTIEKGNVEYSFAFFYYNPEICEPSSPSTCASSSSTESSDTAIETPSNVFDSQFSIDDQQSVQIFDNQSFNSYNIQNLFVPIDLAANISSPSAAALMQFQQFFFVS
ncbi:unnamed protein product [Anisakis simplex]|uniref:Protein ecdysoneless n=1 Tax=Anisakis simplex TaxID=6269 RepID=A0A0M3K1Q3_ANISI|nr:unnamed protein product [Anisakis simplex]